MSAAMAIKACSTFVAFFALVSINGMPISSANALKNKSDQVHTVISVINNPTKDKKKKKKRAMGSRLYLSCFGRHNFVSSEVRLISNQKLVYILTSISVNFTQPLLDIVKALLIRHIINYLPHAKDIRKQIQSTP
jgi:hypothetical protein